MSLHRNLPSLQLQLERLLPFAHAVGDTISFTKSLQYVQKHNLSLQQESQDSRAEGSLHKKSVFFTYWFGVILGNVALNIKKYIKNLNILVLSSYKTGILIFKYVSCREEKYQSIPFMYRSFQFSLFPNRSVLVHCIQVMNIIETFCTYIQFSWEDVMFIDIF